MWLQNCWLQINVVTKNIGHKKIPNEKMLENSGLHEIEGRNLMTGKFLWGYGNCPGSWSIL